MEVSLQQWLGDPRRQGRGAAAPEGRSIAPPPASVRPSVHQRVPSERGLIDQTAGRETVSRAERSRCANNLPNDFTKFNTSYRAVIATGEETDTSGPTDLGRSFPLAVLHVTSSGGSV